MFIGRSIYNLFYPENPVSPETLPKVIKKLEKIYGEYTLARILKCKIGMLKRAKENKGLLTLEQLSLINLMLKIEELIAKEKNDNVEENSKKQ